MRWAERLALTRGGSWCVPDAGAGGKGSRPCNAPCVACPKPRLLSNRVLPFQKCFASGGEGGRVMGNCVSPPAPPSIPPDHPFLWLSGRPLLAWFGRLLGRADTHHPCSQRPLQKDDLRATLRAPQGSAEPRGFGRGVLGKRSVEKRMKPQRIRQWHGGHPYIKGWGRLGAAVRVARNAGSVGQRSR